MTKYVVRQDKRGFKSARYLKSYKINGVSFTGEWSDLLADAGEFDKDEATKVAAMLGANSSWNGTGYKALQKNRCRIGKY